MADPVRPPSFMDNPRLKNLEICKSGRSKPIVRKELAEAMAKLEEMHLVVNNERVKFLKSEERLDRWKSAWKSNHPGEPLDMEECPHKVFVMNADLVEDYRIMHYVIKALQDELEGKEEQ